MASTLLALIDDIATVLDDVAVLSKVAAKKTAGVLGDDLALEGVQAHRGGGRGGGALGRGVREFGVAAEVEGFGP